MPFIGNAPARVPLTSADITDGIITSAKIVDGTIVNADINASAAIDASKLSGVGGLSEVDQWRLTTNFSGTQTVITSNLERVDNASFSVLGTGMTESSGIFTFPSTGKYLVEFVSSARFNGYNRYQYGSIQVTTNNSTYSEVSIGYNTVPSTGANNYASTYASYFFNVTSTTNCKVKFYTESDQTMTWMGDTAVNLTYMTFSKLGN
jgi:hypothetical protein